MGVGQRMAAQAVSWIATLTALRTSASSSPAARAAASSGMAREHRRQAGVAFAQPFPDGALGCHR